ncbi:MAG: hypothetical protein SGARI_004737 [Bacillariaceae sp.]
MRTSFSILFAVLAVLLVGPAAAQRRPRAHRRGAAVPQTRQRNLGKGSDTTAFDTYTTDHTGAPVTETEQEAVIASSSGVEGGDGTKSFNGTPYYIAAGVLLALLAVGIAYWAVAKNRRKKEEEANKEAEKSKSFRLMGAGAAGGAAVAAAPAKKSSGTKKPAPTKKPSVKKNDKSGKSLPLISSSKKEAAPAPAKKSWFKFGKK